MKQTSRILFTVLTVARLLLSACGSASVPASGGKGVFSPPSYTGVVESMNGSVWVINGQTVTVDPSVVDGTINVGDQVKIDVVANADGTQTVTKVEAASPSDASELPQFGPDSGSSNSNDDNGNDANSNDANLNDDNGNDNNSNDANINDDNGNDSNSNDDTVNGNSNDDNSNDANGNDANSNGGNTNDGNSNGGGGNDNGGGGNSNGGGGGGNGNGGGGGGNGNGG